MHNHVSEGSPYDHNKPVDCPDCINELWAIRDELCEKYGWSEWPDALNQGKSFLPKREE